MRLHVEALFTRDDAGRLLVVNEPSGAVAPRFFLGRTANGNLWWFRHDVDAALLNDLRALCESQPTSLDVAADLGNAAPFIARLAREEPVRKTEAGPAFHFPPDLSRGERTVQVTADNATLLSPYLEAWRGDVSTCAPLVVALEDGKAVSICGSVRVTEQAHEAGVETHPDFRRRGHAARAVRTWARTIREMNRIALYSTSWENESSRALANKLGLIQFGADLHMT